MKTYQLHSVSKESTNALWERVLKVSQAHWEFWRSPRPTESQFQHPQNPEGAISGHDSSAEEVLSWPPPSLKKPPVWELGADLPF